MPGPLAPIIFPRRKTIIFWLVPTCASTFTLLTVVDGIYSFFDEDGVGEDDDDVGEDDDDSTDPLDADPVGDWQSDDERRVRKDRQHVAQQPE